MNESYPTLPVDQALIEASLGRVAYQDSRRTITHGEVVEQLLAAGVKVYVIGGAVRAWLCGEVAKDLDLVVDHDTDVVHQVLREAFLGIDAVLLHLERFGLLRWGDGRHEPVDIGILRSTRDICRQDMWNSRFRAQGSLVEDLRMRDFSINAFFYDTAGHVLLDPLDYGLGDLRRKLLRLIAHPEYLASNYRMSLRIVQFLCRGYTPTPNTVEYLERWADHDVLGMGRRLCNWIPANVFAKGLALDDFRERLGRWLRDDASHRLLDQVLAELADAD